ncbi:alpha/beta hydrolase [Nocardia sp. BMG111209]|uniref:alpha/beta hydrolase n=1 Tax=Nocardia sp. BMG111209 TaxID=1160137 RepID=UPI001E34A97D|nr:alpha/beta hydrolase [Nocardia sp. BMG111209]
MGQLEPPVEWPALDDPAAWRELLAARDATALMMIEQMFPAYDTAVEDIDVDGVRVYAITPAGVDPDDRRIVLDIHGGGFVGGGGPLCRMMAVGQVTPMAVRAWSVDYRLPPDHPYPAPLDDCLTAYRALLGSHRPEDIIVNGPSAGGNLAAAMILRARDEGLPLPAAVVLTSPVADLTGAGDSWQTNMGIEPSLTSSFTAPFGLYAGGHDLRDPYVSPLFADFTRGFPPTFLSTGTRDVLLSDTVRLHRALHRAGVPVELHVFEAAGHGMFLGTAPEDREYTVLVREFLGRHWALYA